MSDKLDKVIIAIGALRQHLANDQEGKRLADATAQAICDYYKTDVARAGNYVIKNMLSKSPHVHVSETPVETWGYRVNLACDNCGAEESHTLTKTVVDIATAINIARHKDCKPKPPAIIVHNPSTAIN
jgi:hypothetical protein